jgi:glycine betaine/proline transport system permease protein
MAIRQIPKLDIHECVPSAIDIGSLRIDNKALDFIQRQLSEADRLEAQISNATQYSELVTISERVGSMVHFAEKKTDTLSSFVKSDSNPLTEVNNSEQIHARIQELTTALSEKISSFSSEFSETAANTLAQYSQKINNLQSQIDGLGVDASSYQGLVSISDQVKVTLESLGQQAALIKTLPGSEDLLAQISQLSETFESKAHALAPWFENHVQQQMNALNAQIDGLDAKVDGLSTLTDVNVHVGQVKEVADVIASSAKMLNTVDVAPLIQNINELSIATDAKVVDLIASAKQIASFDALRGNPEALAHAVKETALRTNVSAVEDLNAVASDTPALLAKLSEMSAQLASSNLGELSGRAMRSLDTTISRFEIRFKSELRVNTNPDGVDFSLSSRVADLSDKTQAQFADVMSSDPATLSAHIGQFPGRVQDVMETSDTWLFLSKAVSIPNDIMMNSRGCVDSAFKDFTRAYGDTIEWSFAWLDSFLNGFEGLLLATPWPIFLLIIGALAYLGSHSYKVTIGSMLAIFMVGVFDMWNPMISTITMIAVATLLCLAIGIPLGVWMSRSERVQSMITPVLDIMQTIPSFVYLIPVVMLLGIGEVPGLIAVMIYAMPPIVRLTNLGLRLVDKEAMEAADAFGATYKQRLFTVQIPLALPNIFAGVNQTIMMALAMVVIASMIGVAGLGLPVLQAVQNQYLSMGMLNGLAIVVLAIVFDRVSQAFGARIQKHRSGDIL